MNLREQALASVNGTEILPVPTDVMENLIYPGLESALCHHHGLEPNDHEGLLRRLGACLRWGKPAYIGPPLDEAPIQPPSAFPNKKATRSIWGSWSGLNTYSDEIDRPLKGVESVSEVHAHRWPEPDWFDYRRIGYFEDSPAEYASVVKWAERNRDFGRVVGGFDPVFSRIMDLCGMEHGLMLMAAYPEVVDALVGHIGEFLEEYYRRIAGAGRDHIDFLAFGDDFAGQSGMLVSPDRWRSYFLPLWRKLFAIAHEHDMKALMHSCGCIRPVLGDLIDAGLDVFEVVQVSADGMDASDLKREFGAHLTFYGGMDTQHVLPFGSADDVRAEVRRLVDILGVGGRFILASTHLLMEDAPYENVLAMYDEAHSYVPGGGAQRCRN